MPAQLRAGPLLLEQPALIQNLEGVSWDAIPITALLAFALQSTEDFFLRKNRGWEWWLTPVIPALWEAETRGVQDQLANMVKPYLY